MAGGDPGPRAALSRRSFTLGLAAAGLPARVGSARADTPPLHLALAARPPWLANQVALTRGNEMFLGLPRADARTVTPSLARRRADGTMAPFPGNAWNEWQPGRDGQDAFVYLNSVHIFADDTVWCVDTGAIVTPATARPPAQKLVRLDQRTGRVLDVLRFDADILPPGARMNDLRFHGAMLYVTDSGLGGLIVHDMASGRTRRRLSGYRQLRATDVPLPAVLRRGRDEPPFRPPNSDMIEVTADGAWLYWAAPTGPLYRIETGLLNDPAVTDEVLAGHIQHVADIPFSAGCAMDSRGNLYLSESGTGRITLLAPDGRTTVLASDPALNRPDGSFISIDRHLYVPMKLRQADQLYGIYALALPDTFDGIALGSAVNGSALR